MDHKQMISCPDCDGVSRRGFLQVGAGIAAAGLAQGLVRADEKKATVSAEGYVKELYDKLTDSQKKELCFPANHELRQRVSANWHITKPTIESLSEVQQDLCEKIVQGLSSEEGFEKFMQQMAEDDGGIGRYSIALFGKPGEGSFEFVLTGRHVTMRADGNSEAGVAFGGPMVYGHAVSGTEPADHKGNVFWYQGKRANEVFGALDEKQRKVALIEKAPAESDIKFRKEHPGLAVEEMSSDQKDLVKKVMGDLLSPYRKQDVDEVMEIITSNGGLEKIHLSFYKQERDGSNADLGNDQVWDIWRLDGPGFVWHFRGYPHVHTWVNIAKV